MRTGVLATLGAIGLAAAVAAWGAAPAARTQLWAHAGGNYDQTNEPAQGSDSGNTDASSRQRADGGDYPYNNEPHQHADAGEAPAPLA